MKKEQWKNIEGFEYDVSNHGRVRSRTRLVLGVSRTGKVFQREHRGRILAPRFAGNNSYAFIELSRDGILYRHSISRLVAEFFVKKESKEYDTVLHLDDDPTNNYFENLRWGTQALNMMDMCSKNRQARGEFAGGAKLTNADVKKIVELLNIGSMTQQAIADLFGVKRLMINRIKCGKNWTHVTGFQPR